MEISLISGRLQSFNKYVEKLLDAFTSTKIKKIKSETYVNSRSLRRSMLNIISISNYLFDNDSHCELFFLRCRAFNGIFARTLADLRGIFSRYICLQIFY